jgi:hypothetical protein
MKQYSSFSEIDERLRILKLQRAINAESLKLHLNRTKASLYPTELLGGAKGILQKIALTFAIKKLSNISGLLRTFRSRERMEVAE